jgi:hypothetical protein
VAVRTDTLELALANAAKVITIVPGRAEATPGERVSFLLVGIPELVLVGRAVPVETTVRWTVHGADGERSLPAGEQFVFPRGAGVDEAELLLRPQLVDHTGAAQDVAPLVRRVRATVTLTATPLAPVTVERRLEVEVEVLPLLVPSVRAVSRAPQFAGAASAVVPADSPFADSAALTARLSALASTLDALSPIPEMAVLRAGVEVLRGVIAGSNVRFRRLDTALGRNGAPDVHAGHEPGSLILLGAEGIVLVPDCRASGSRARRG